MTHSQKTSSSRLLFFILLLSSSFFSSCSIINKDKSQPGQSLGISSIPNLRDLGGYKTINGEIISRGLVYRSNQFNNISEKDMLLLEELNLKNVFDLRTALEREGNLDELPKGVTNIWLDILEDDPTSGPANLIALLSDPLKANIELGDGKIEKAFEASYREFVSLPSAQKGFRELFLTLGKQDQLPAVFHCTTGKDRTGWAAASLLTLIGVPMETVKSDYLRSNEYILPMYESLIQKFIADGGKEEIPFAILGVKEQYLDAAFDEMRMKYGDIEHYFSEGLGINEAQQEVLRNLYIQK